MAEKRRFLDVWIVESNVVYREVPFAVVADWVQQGRLLEDDMLRPSGTAEWHRLGGMPEFTPYLPREEPLRPQDQAEALEPVAIDIAWKHRPDEEEDDPDMIPLIDVSLVLLIFFIMTTTGVAAASGILTPAAYYGLKSSNPDFLTIGINCDDSREPIVYLLALGEKPAETEYEVPEKERDALRKDMKPPPAFLEQLDQRLASMEGQVEVVIKTSENLKDGYYLNLLVELERRRVKVKNKYDGVREKATP
jgi:hypothetical protein